MHEVLVALVPVLLLLVALLLGRYPGHAAAMRLGDLIASRRRPALAAGAGLLRSRPLDVHAARGGLLLAFGLSGRAPPARPAQ